MLDFQCAPSGPGPQIKTEPNAGSESSVALLSSLSSQLGFNSNHHSRQLQSSQQQQQLKQHPTARQSASSPGYHSAASSPGSLFASSPASSSSGCCPTTSTTSSPTSGGSRSPMSPNLLDYFPDMNQDGIGLSWFHDANSRSQLNTALMSSKIIVAGDVSLAEMSRYPVPIMARPPLGVSNITLEHWLQEVSQARPQRGIKLTFTSTRTVEPAFRVLARHAELLKGPVILNADILTRPIASHHQPSNQQQQLQQNPDQQPVDAWTFLMLCRTRFPKSIISIGWCTNPSDESCSGAASESSIADSSSSCSLHSTTAGPNQHPTGSASGADPMFELELLNEASAHLGQLQQQLHQHFHPYSSFVAPARVPQQVSQSANAGSILHQQLLNRHHHHSQLNHHHHHHHILSSTGSLNSSSGNSSASPSPTSPGSHLQLHSPASSSQQQQQRQRQPTNLISKLSQHHTSAETSSLSSAAEQLFLAAAAVSQSDHQTSSSSPEAAAAAAMAAAVMAATNFHQHQQLPMNLNINEANGAASRNTGASQLAQRLKSSPSCQPHNLTQTPSTTGHHHLSNGKRLALDSEPTPNPKHHHSQQQQHLLLKTANSSQQQVAASLAATSNSGAGNGNSGPGYTREMIDKMASLVKEYNLTQPVTFPVEARLIRNSLGELQRLLYQVGANSTLTVVAQQEDLISVDDLLVIRKAFASNQILFDLPDHLSLSLRQELDLL